MKTLVIENQSRRSIFDHNKCFFSPFSNRDLQMTGFTILAIVGAFLFGIIVIRMCWKFIAERRAINKTLEAKRLSTMNADDRNDTATVNAISRGREMVSAITGSYRHSRHEVIPELQTEVLGDWSALTLNSFLDGKRKSALGRVRSELLKRDGKWLLGIVFVLVIAFVIQTTWLSGSSKTQQAPMNPPTSQPTPNFPAPTI